MIVRYIHKYESVEDFEEDYNGQSYLEPWISATKIDEEVYQIDYNKHNDNSQR